MTSAFVTGGTVSITERRKLGDYEHKEVSAVFTFSSDGTEGHRAIAQVAAEDCIAMVRQLATGKAPVPVCLAPPAAAAAAAEEHAEEKAKRTRGPNKPKVDPAQAELEAEIAQVKAAIAQSEAAPVDDVEAEFMMDEPAAELPPVSDADMVGALAKKNQALSDSGSSDGPARIKALIWSYIPQPGRASTIDQKFRREFLAKLAAL